MNIYATSAVKKAKYFVLATFSLLTTLLLARILTYLFGFSINPIYRSYTDGVLRLVPGYMEDVDFSTIGVDLHAIMGICFFALFTFGIYKIIPKLFRVYKPAKVLGIVDTWTHFMFFSLSFGLVIEMIELNPGSSIITDFCHQLVTFAASGSVINEIHLNTLFLMIVVILIGILSDLLLKMKFPLLRHELVAPILELQDFEVIATLNWPKIEVISNIGFLRNIKSDAKEKYQEISGGLHLDQLHPKKLVAWKSWLEYIEA